MYTQRSISNIKAPRFSKELRCLSLFTVYDRREHFGTVGTRKRVRRRNNAVFGSYYAYFNKEAVPAKSYVLALMESVRALTPFQQSIFTFLSVETAYHNALNTYFEATLTKPEVASTLIEAEKAYTAYTLDSENAEKRTGFITLMEQLATAYAALSDEDKSYLDGMYQYYFAAYEKLTATTEQAA